VYYYLQTVIEDGVMKNILPDLQQYLLQKKEYSRGSYQQIKSTCVSLATNYIKYGNMGKAKEILLKLVTIIHMFTCSKI
jgi:hypothetical protein